MDSLPIFTCPNCGGTAVTRNVVAEWVEFVGASRQVHHTCRTEVVALPIDYGRPMHVDVGRPSGCECEIERGDHPCISCQDDGFETQNPKWL